MEHTDGIYEASVTAWFMEIQFALTLFRGMKPLGRDLRLFTPTDCQLHPLNVLL
jgi:hypothetical protein